MVGVFVEGTVMLLCSTHLLFVTMAGFWMFLIACQYQKFAGTDARKRSNLAMDGEFAPVSSPSGNVPQGI